jgi:hypothetical protein
MWLWLIVDDLLKAGEFSIDLYTMPDGLTNKLWDHLVRTLHMFPDLQRDIADLIPSLRRASLLDYQKLEDF